MRGTLPIFVLLALFLGACSHTPAPVEDRSSQTRIPVPVDGLYKVKSGDTLHGIAFKYGLDYRDVAGWNNIRSPYVIFPDQIVRLRRPANYAGSSRSTGSTEVKTTGISKPRASTAQTRPAPSTTTPTTSGTSGSGSSSTSSAASRPPAKAASSSSSNDSLSVSSTTPGSWIWPTDGRLLRTYKSGDPSRNGLDIKGKEGQAVKASAGGEVVYSGNGLIGYGELVIIKHDDRMLSAYAHNRQRLVAEGERVTQGQKIAELGRNDRDEEVLHFEIRRDGKPVDPMTYLPRK